MGRNSGSGRIERESDSVDALVHTMAETIGQQSAAGVYLSGKRLTGTKAVGLDQLQLEFEGEWDLLITGVFKLTLIGKPDAGDINVNIQGEHKFDVEAEAIDEDEAIEEGKRLMRGDT